jgi:hypothetical protein
MAVLATARLRTYVFTRQRSWPSSGRTMNFSEFFTEGSRQSHGHIFKNRSTLNGFMAVNKHGIYVSIFSCNASAQSLQSTIVGCSSSESPRVLRATMSNHLEDASVTIMLGALT